MSWYINEALVDLSIVPELLGIYNANVKKDDLALYLSTSEINIDLIDDEIIPEQYSNIYQWLAEDVELVLSNLGLVDKNNNLSKLGEYIKDNNINPYNGFISSLLINWQDENQILIKFLTLLDNVDKENITPYSGLTLPESFVAFKMLDSNESIESCINTIKENIAGAKSESKEDICLHIDEKYELLDIDIARTRATLIWFVVSSFISYDDLLEPIQHIIKSKSVQTILEIYNDFPKDGDAMTFVNKLNEAGYGN